MEKKVFIIKRFAMLPARSKKIEMVFYGVDTPVGYLPGKGIGVGTCAFQ